VLISKPKYEVVSIERLEKFGANADVTPDTLLQAGIIKKKRGRVKILGDGTLKHPLTVRAHAFSKSALQKITSAGGKTEQLGSAKAAKTSESE
jgi:large subunit ribosomal protein L15